MTNWVRRSSLLTVFLGFISVIAAGVLRAEPPPDMQQGGGLTVDFLALSGTGQHVTDLQPADVSIKVGGKQRTVSSLRYTKVDSGGTAPASALAAPFAVNTASTGRNLLILIDNESLKVGTERAIRESLDQVLSQLGPADRVAFSVAPRDSVQLGFGAGLAAVRAAVAQFAGIKPATVTDAENACRSRDSLVLLRTMMEHIPDPKRRRPSSSSQPAWPCRVPPPPTRTAVPASAQICAARYRPSSTNPSPPRWRWDE